MSLKKASVAAVIAVSMASTPILAQTVQTSAAPLSVAARSGAVVSGEASDLRGGFIIPLIAIVAIILGILAATGGKDRPHSP
jgi:sugar phosphate permease